VRIRIVLALALLTATIGLAPTARSAKPTVIPPGCDEARPAAAFHSDGSPATATPPVACSNYTGYGAQEPHIVVAPDGDVFEQPARVPTGKPMQQQGGIAWGHAADGGGAWELLLPEGHTFQTNDNSIQVDPETGRLFLSIPTGYPTRTTDPLGVGQLLAPGEAEILTSTPAGHYADWKATTMTGLVGIENPRFTTGPAPAGQPEPVAGERMTYWCTNTNPAGASPPILGRVCYRSLDGGASWQQGALLFTVGVPQHPECGANGEKFAAIDGNYPYAGPDGRLWTMVQCGTTTFLARSDDEAATFPVLHRQDGSPVTIPFTSTSGSREMRIDASGNLYAMERDGSALLLRISRDGGLTWTPPLNLTAPSARNAAVGQWQMAVRGTGKLAVSYLAANPAGGQDGYITVTDDALAADPTFFGSTVNDPATPLVTSTGPGDDFIDLDLAADGTPWAAFYADCSDAAEFCRPQATVIGRLVAPGGKKTHT
jgi:hypothetical protein